jgi:hypothetical protein
VASKHPALVGAADPNRPLPLPDRALEALIVYIGCCRCGYVWRLPERVESAKCVEADVTAALCLLGPSQCSGAQSWCCKLLVALPAMDNLSLCLSFYPRFCHWQMPHPTCTQPSLAPLPYLLSPYWLAAAARGLGGTSVIAEGAVPMDTDGGPDAAYALLLEHAACRAAPRALLATALEASAALAAPGGGNTPSVVAATTAMAGAAPGPAGAVKGALAQLRATAALVGAGLELMRARAAEDRCATLLGVG